ncbi:MAG: pilus assembly protein [Chloroflexota bacterium]|nr:pilus assembly protein [Chloroflexota bacterium]
MTRPARLRAPGRRASGRGQSLVEFALMLPLMLMILFGMMEFGFVFSHHLTLEYATREGARLGAALGAGNADAPCSGTTPEPVDWQIIAAVQRVITSPGSQVPPARVSEIRIYKATATGAETAGVVNVWVPGAGPTVDGVRLQFTPSTTAWSACGRNSGASPDSLGISLVYSYRYVTPLGTLMGIMGPATITISDRTIMALNPPAG